MLRLANIGELDGLLLQVPGLVDAFERKSPDYTDDVHSWLERVEQALENNRLPLAGVVAGLRAELATIALGARPPWLAFTGRPTVSKVRRVAASTIMKRVVDTVEDHLHADRARFAEAERVVRQLVVMAKACECIPPELPARNRTDALRAAWSTVKTHPELRSGALHVEGLLESTDVLVQLDRALAGEERA